ncbi:MAG: hypothetical protein AAFY60_21255, partial [Myxococcota bacterium]
LKKGAPGTRQALEGWTQHNAMAWEVGARLTIGDAPVDRAKASLKSTGKKIADSSVGNATRSFAAGTATAYAKGKERGSAMFRSLWNGGFGKTVLQPGFRVIDAPTERLANRRHTVSLQRKDGEWTHYRAEIPDIPLALISTREGASAALGASIPGASGLGTVTYAATGMMATVRAVRAAIDFDGRGAKASAATAGKRFAISAFIGLPGGLVLAAGGGFVEAFAVWTAWAPVVDAACVSAGLAETQRFEEAVKPVHTHFDPEPEDADEVQSLGQVTALPGNDAPQIDKQA